MINQHLNRQFFYFLSLVQQSSKRFIGSFLSWVKQNSFHSLVKAVHCQISQHRRELSQGIQYWVILIYYLYEFMHLLEYCLFQPFFFTLSLQIGSVFGPQYLLKLYVAGAVVGSIFYLVHHAYLANTFKVQGINAELHVLCVNHWLLLHFLEHQLMKKLKTIIYFLLPLDLHGWGFLLFY